MSKQNNVEAIAVMVQSAVDTLKVAKELADESGVYFDFSGPLRELYEDVTGDYPDWYASSY